MFGFGHRESTNTIARDRVYTLDAGKIRLTPASITIHHGISA